MDRMGDGDNQQNTSKAAGLEAATRVDARVHTRVDLPADAASVEVALGAI